MTQPTTAQRATIVVHVRPEQQAAFEERIAAFLDSLWDTDNESENWQDALSDKPS